MFMVKGSEARMLAIEHDIVENVISRLVLRASTAGLQQVLPYELVLRGTVLFCRSAQHQKAQSDRDVGVKRATSILRQH